MYFIFGYVETALTECVALASATAVTGLKGLAKPSAASTGAAVAGTIFWNLYDEVNGNSFVYDAKKELVVVNSNATDAVILTVKTLNPTIGGFLHTVADFIITLTAGQTWWSGILPNAFKDGTLVKLSIAESGGDALGDVFLAVVKKL